MKKNLTPGDVLYREKGLVEHAGVYLGQERVIHNVPNGNTQITSLEDYSNGKTIKVISNNLTEPQQKTLATNVEHYLSIDKNYNLLKFNCEHLATTLLDGAPSSKQIQGAALGALSALLLATKSKSKNALLFTLIGGVIGFTAVNLLREYDYTA